MDGVVFTYDVTNAASFAHIAEWVLFIKSRLGGSHVPDSPLLVLCGNKIDESDRPRRVATVQGLGMAKRHEIPLFYEVSAKSGDNVEPMFMEIAAKIVSRRQGGSLDDGLTSADRV